MDETVLEMGMKFDLHMIIFHATSNIRKDFPGVGEPGKAHRKYRCSECKQAIYTRYPRLPNDGYRMCPTMARISMTQDSNISPALTRFLAQYHRCQGSLVLTSGN